MVNNEKGVAHSDTYKFIVTDILHIINLFRIVQLYTDLCNSIQNNEGYEITHQKCYSAKKITWGDYHDVPCHAKIINKGVKSNPPRMQI